MDAVVTRAPPHRIARPRRPHRLNGHGHILVRQRHPVRHDVVLRAEHRQHSVAGLSFRMSRAMAHSSTDRMRGWTSLAVASSTRSNAVREVPARALEKVVHIDVRVVWLMRPTVDHVNRPATPYGGTAWRAAAGPRNQPSNRRMAMTAPTIAPACKSIAR